MERYLLFNPGCTLCTQVTQAVEREADGWLSGRSLHDPQMQMLLKKARPNARWEPTLLEVNGEQVRAFTGVALELQLALGLGPQRCWQILRLIDQAALSRNNAESARRTFLKGAAGVLAGVAIGGVPSLGQAAPSIVLDAKQSPPQGTWYVLSSKQTDKLVSKTKKSSYYRHFANQLPITSQDEYAFSLDLGQDVLVTLPMVYQGSNRLNAFSSVLSKKGNRKPNKEGETIAFATEHNGDIHHVKAWYNSHLVADLTLTTDGTIMQGYTIKNGMQVDLSGQNLASDGQRLYQLFLSNLNESSTLNLEADAIQPLAATPFECLLNCANSQGLSGFILAAISAVCAAVCLGTIGLGCAGCIGALGGGAVAVIGTCIFVCNANPGAY